MMDVGVSQQQQTMAGRLCVVGCRTEQTSGDGCMPGVHVHVVVDMRVRLW
jgi:hypothetical protein